ncbi:hypothetical protein SDC9_192242 [bioreactor metagenome]|uniref:Uncharacterized protein n=1 Tax=bioreactor metagenome TaxID=1076179 RepID=A0A645I085_9ZZZZ
MLKQITPINHTFLIFKTFFTSENVTGFSLAVSFISGLKKNKINNAPSKFNAEKEIKTICMLNLTEEILAISQMPIALIGIVETFRTICRNVTSFPCSSFVPRRRVIF